MDLSFGLIFSFTAYFQKAEAELAYELQAAKEKQKIRSEEMEIEVVERRKMIEVEEKEILRKEKELMGTVKRPAEAEAFRMELIAEGQRLVRTSVVDVLICICVHFFFFRSKIEFSELYC